MSTYEIRSEHNYAPKVIRVRNLIELPGLDNLRGVSVDGYLALVSKDTLVNSLMVMFPAEAQLSGEFAKRFNLFRKSELNADVNTTGYLENHRRIKAIKLRGHVSSALLLPAWEPDMVEGLEFDTLDGEKISWKYVPPAKGPSRTNATPTKDKIFGDVTLQLKEHPDTSQYLREQHTIPDDAHLIISQKIHGTSVRAAWVQIERDLAWWESLLVRLGVKLDTKRWAWAVGSRKVIKSVSGTGKESSDHWYKEGDIWTSVMADFESLIPKGMALYGEIYGYAPNSQTPIQQGYTYDAKPGEAKFIAYRVVNGDYDLSDAAAREFCAERGIAFVPKLSEMGKAAFEPELWMDNRFYDQGMEQAIPLADESPVDEGVVVLVEGLVPRRFKVKGPQFYLYETADLDRGEEVLS